MTADLQIREYLDRLFVKLHLPQEEEQALREEMEAHLRERARDYILKGYSEEDAARLAVAGFGQSAVVGGMIMHATPADRWALLRHRLGDAVAVLALPVALGLAQYAFSVQPPLERPEPINLFWVLTLLYTGPALAGTLALYLPGWLRRRRGLVWAFNPPALVYLSAALYISASGLAPYVPGLWHLYPWPHFTFWLTAAYSPVPGILLGIAVGESIKNKDPEFPLRKKAATLWQQSLWHLAGISVFGLLFFVFFRYSSKVNVWARSFSEELLLQAAWSSLILGAAAALGIPRMVSILRSRRAAAFDWTKFALFTIPGLLILFSFTLYFWIPVYPVKQALGMLFAYFSLHKWTAVGAVTIGLGLWMSVRTTGDA